MNIVTIFSTAFGYLLVKCFTKSSPNFNETCAIIVFSLMFQAAVIEFWFGETPDYPSVIAGCFLGYALLCLYERIRQ